MSIPIGLETDVHMLGVAFSTYDDPNGAAVLFVIPPNLRGGLRYDCPTLGQYLQPILLLRCQYQLHNDHLVHQSPLEVAISPLRSSVTGLVSV